MQTDVDTGTFNIFINFNAFVSGIASAQVPEPSGSMKCAVCNSVVGNEECNNEGLSCDATKNQVCQTVVRIENNLPARYEKRCKQKLACENEKAMYKSYGMCGGRYRNVNVCVHCCTGDFCNLQEP